MRLGPQRVRVVTGGATGMADLKWFADHLQQASAATISDLTSAWTRVGLWGRGARDVLASVTPDDVSHQGFKFGTCREVELGGVTVLASRISYVGELGWELYAPMEEGRRAWDTIWDAGHRHGLVPVGIGVYATPARLDKGDPPLGAGLAGSPPPCQAAMAPPPVHRH